MKKLVLKLDLHDDKSKQKAMKTVSRLSGIDSISIDMKDQKLTVIGNVDPIEVVSKFRKGNWHADLLSVGPAKEEKKDQQGGKKDDPKDDKKKDSNDQNAELLTLYKSNPYSAPYYHVSTIEENPNVCVIC